MKTTSLATSTARLATSQYRNLRGGVLRQKILQTGVRHTGVVNPL
ncbi:hypothetical protein ODS41_04120 [Pyrobaculum sp. 3827-6]|nr:hypothetical protein [Pyrobaculum sp. 3827-6]